MGDVSRRKRKQTELPLCQYGSKCYRKNPDHLKKFRHSDKIDEIEKSSSSEEDNVESKIVSPTSEEESSDDASEKSTGNSTNRDKVEKSSDDASEKSTSNSTNGDKVEKGSVEVKFTDTVGDILKKMPKDFFDFWDFCSSVNKSNPEEAFADLGFHLVGIYDLLSKKIPSDKVVNLHCHWRYYYDPPEFQTVIKLDGKDLYHIGYFRDDPNDLPTILASNSAKVDCKLTLKGDNIFAAMNFEITEVIKKSKSKKSDKFDDEILVKLKNFANKKKYSLDLQSPKTKARNKKVVAKTFHGLGIVVPVVNDIGYRPLPDSNATVKNVLKKIVSAGSDEKRLEEEESLDELISNIQFANDECDYGMGLELGLDLFCFGDPYFHTHILHLLPLAYELLKRPKYAEVVKLHLANRKKSDDFEDLEVKDS